MSLRGAPGYNPRDLVTVIPLGWDAGTDPDVDLGGWERKGPDMRVISRKLSSAQAFRAGKQDQDVAFVLYADHRPYSTFPLTEKDRIWHPRASERNSDGTPNFGTSMDIDSIVEHDSEGVAQIDVRRTT